ncbi:DUF6069 family protein [Spirillospora sp. CA-108201]
MTSDVTSSGLGAVQAPATASRAVPMWRTGLIACVAAAAATTAVAALGRSAGASLEVDGEPIPLLGFPQLTLLFGVIGVLLAVALRRWAPAPRRAFLAATAVLTALSVVPDLIVPATVPTRLTLIAAHLVAAAIVVPLVAARLPARTR